MFCSNCGNNIEAADNFCNACGSKTGGAKTGGATAAPKSNASWHTSLRYLDVVREGEVAQIFALAETEGGSSYSGDDFVSLITPLSPVKGFTTDVLRAGEKLSFGFYDKLGFTTNLIEKFEYPFPAGKVIAAVACALASEKQTIQEVDQMSDGCLIKVRVPPGITTGAKYMDVRVTRQDMTTQVEATVNSIKGKWQRKSTQAAADELHKDIERFLRLMG